MRYSYPLWLLAVVNLLLAPVAGARAEDAPPPSISSTGEAIVYVAPDEVVVNFGIETFDADLDKAKQLNDQGAARLVKAFKDAGVESKHVQTDTLQLEVTYRGNRAWEGVAGYFARRAYVVTLKDVKNFEKLVDAGLKNGANQLLGFTFRTTELRKYRDQARAMAAKAAKEKAVALAKELDCTVGKPRQISESYEGGFGSRMTNMTQNAMQFGGAAGGDSGDTLPPGQLAVRAVVSVTFDLKS